MGIAASIMTGSVMHRRLVPKVNSFKYSIYYVALPLSKLKLTPILKDSFGKISFYNSDHGRRDGSDLENWARDILKEHGVTSAEGEIVLLTMPRVMGYVFNPVSFWLCYDKSEKLRAVLCEVNNTFNETHTYLCIRPDQGEIKSQDVFEGDKLFHVSPFLSREGGYAFKFDVGLEQCTIQIDYSNALSQKQLVTALKGDFKPMTKTELNRLFWLYPLLTVKATFLIHWQALKLLMKQASYKPLPKQLSPRVSLVNKIKKM